MPVISPGSDRPDWVEIHESELILLGPDRATRTLSRTYPSEFIACISGQVQVITSAGRVTLQRSDWMRLEGEASVMAVIPYVHGTAAQVMHVKGDWSDLYDVNIFQATAEVEVEVHYHDYHEYWIIVHGNGPIETEGERGTVAPGDIVATPLGFEHGMPRSQIAIEGLAVETAVRGQGRLGHLHRATHGAPDEHAPEA